MNVTGPCRHQFIMCQLIKAQRSCFTNGCSIYVYAYYTTAGKNKRITKFLALSSVAMHDLAMSTLRYLTVLNCFNRVILGDLYVQ